MRCLAWLSLVKILQLALRVNLLLMLHWISKCLTQIHSFCRVNFFSLIWFQMLDLKLIYIGVGLILFLIWPICYNDFWEIFEWDITFGLWKWIYMRCFLRISLVARPYQLKVWFTFFGHLVSWSPWKITRLPLARPDSFLIAWPLIHASTWPEDSLIWLVPLLAGPN